MDFSVYDNIYTFNKREPFNGIHNTRLECDSIDIPENHSFWFHTNMNMIANNVNLNKRYVHIHEGIGTTNKPTFSKEPFIVTRSNLRYNPKERRIEIGGGLFSKPVFAKKCLYYGGKLPTKKMNIIGGWFYNFSTDTMTFIIDYMPEKVDFEWEDKSGEEPATFEQLKRVEELEAKINLLQNSDHVSDP